MLTELPCNEAGWREAACRDLEAFASEHRQTLDSATRDGRFPVDIYREMGRRGWVGVVTPAELGGTGGGVAEYCVIEEAVGRFGLVPPQVAIQGQLWLLAWGTTEQTDRYLRGIADGSIVFSESISEKGVGSSLKEMRTTATRSGADWILTGHKTHVNLGADSHVTLVYAIADEGLTAFLVDTNTPGFSANQTDPIGLRLMPTADVSLESVRVPASAVLGEVGRGLDTFLTTFNISRLGNASECIGLGRRALTAAIDYASQRQVGPDMVTDFQGIRWIVADRYTDLVCASLARDAAAVKVDAGEEHALATTIAKKCAIEAAEKAVNDVFALIGGHGLYHEQQFIQILQDVKVLRIAGGSLEVLRNYVARRVVGSGSLEGLR